jgi:hypothetical protein
MAVFNNCSANSTSHLAAFGGADSFVGTKDKEQSAAITKLDALRVMTQMNVWCIMKPLTVALLTRSSCR